MVEIQSYKDLEIYKNARRIVKVSYQIASHLPSEERYISGRHIKESSHSQAANIAEGWGRYHFKDRIKFLYNARGSLFELESFVETAVEIGLLDKCPRELIEEFRSLVKEQGIKLNNTISSLSKRAKQE